MKIKKFDYEQALLLLGLVILLLVLVNIFILDHCNPNYIIYYWIIVGIIAVVWIIFPFISIDPTFNWKDHYLVFLPGVIVIVLALLSISRAFYHYHGVSIIRAAEIDEIYTRYLRGSLTTIEMANVHYLEKGNVKHDVVQYYNYYGKSKAFVRVYFDCKILDSKLYGNRSNYSKIHDFAFLDDTTFYTYHDFSLIKPDLVYYQVGYNVLYNAVCDTSAIADSTVLLSFTDVLGKDQTVKYSVKGYPSIPDTFLVYRNINEKLDTKWHVSAPEVNTPENRAKISDYGYIFHYDVYSKQEIESQCPRIKEYVEQYKKRMSDNNTNSTESTAQEPE